MLFHPQQTAEIFNALLGSRIANEDNVFFAGLISLVIACPAIVIGAVIAPPGGRVREVTEIAVLLAWFAAAGPILAFTLYFCLWHALRHSLRSMARTGEPTLATAIRRYARDVWAPTLGTIILASLAVPFLASCDTPASLIWRIVFVGLFALTVPHVLLEFRNERRPR
jgi:Brp/Blh family beta-carotene 15,15'-monooxygenase